MKKGTTFFWKIMLIAASLLAIDQGLGALLTHYYFRVTHSEQGRMTLFADSVTTPLLVIGSSRAEHGYIPGILSDSFRLECYNGGKDKQGIFFELAMEKMALQRYHPQLVILDLSPVAFASEQSGLDDLAVLLPYYWTHPEIRPILDKRSSWERLKTLSKLYCYNSLVLQIAKNTIRQQEDDSVSNGYVPKFLTLPPIPLLGYRQQDLSASNDSGCVAAFREFIATAKHNDCPLVVVVSPLYDRLSTGSTSISFARAICDAQKIPFFDYTLSPDFNNRTDLFDDPIHLNDAGAQQFTRRLCSDLRAIGFH